MQTSAIVNTLRLIFYFKQLPLCYFIKLPALLINYRSLKDEVRDHFLITNRFALRNLSFYRKKLALHYDLSKIPDSYFELLLPKILLPTAYQKLNSVVRDVFLFDTSDESVLIREIVRRLREYYKFTIIPNDYFVQKVQLPKDL